VDRVIANLGNPGGLDKAIEFLHFTGRGLISNDRSEKEGGAAAFPPDSLRPLALALLNAARKPGFPNGGIDQVQSSLPLLQKLAPADAAAFARAHPRRAENSDESVASGPAFQIVSDPGLAEQPAADSPVADFVLVNDVALDEVRRLIARSGVSQQEQQRALEEAEHANRKKSEAKKRGNTQPFGGSFTNSQVSFYLQWARSLLGRNDRKNAAALLEDARALLPAEPETGRQMDLLIQIATVYCDLDPGRAAELAPALLRKINELLPSLVVVGNFIMSDEMTLMQNGELLLSSYLSMGADQEIGLLTRIAQSDPDAALKLADGLQRPELRTLVYLKIAAALLGKENHGQWFPRRAFSGFVVD
jgi:hypothetical protein